MGILGNIFLGKRGPGNNGILGDSEIASWETPGTPLTPISFVISDVYGADPDTLPVSVAEALFVPAVNSAVNLLNALCAQLPLVARDSTGTPIAKQPTWLSRTDNYAQSAYLRQCYTLEDILFHGESLWFIKTRGADGFPLEVSHVDYPCWFWDMQAQRYRINDQFVNTADVIYINSGYRGLLNIGAEVIRTGRAIQRTTRKRAELAVPVQVLQNTSNDTLTDADIQTLLQQYSQARKRGDPVLYVEQGLELTLQDDSPNNGSFESRNAISSEIAKLTLFPSGVLEGTGSVDSLTYVTRLGEMAEVIDITLPFYLAAIEARLSLNDLCPNGQSIAFDLSSLKDKNPAPEKPQSEPVAPGPAPEASTYE